MHRKLVLLGTVCVSLVGSSPVIYAQTSGFADKARATIFGRESQHRRLLKKEFREIEPPEKSYLDQEEKKSTSTKDASEQFFTFDNIYLEGVTLLTVKEQQKLLKPFLNKRLKLEQLNNILKVITNAYIKRGYVTTRAYLKPQNITRGKLEILVLEGEIGSFTIKDNGKKRKGSHNAIPKITGKNLNLRDLEQGIDQITRLSSFDATIEVEPGDAPGKSNVIVETEIGRKWNVATAIDNYGTNLVGKNQFEFSGHYNDLFGLYDSLAINYRENMGSGSVGKLSRSITAQVSIPFGYWTVRYLASKFEYKTAVSGDNGLINLSGNSYNNRVEVERIVHRSDIGKTGVAVGLNVRDTKNFSANNISNLSSTNKVSAGEMRLFHVRRLQGGVFYLGLSYVKGLPILGASRDNNPTDSTPRMQFDKSRVDLSYMRPFTLGKQDFYWELQSAFQYSAKTLTNEDRITLGGHYTVHGFQENSISGDTGGYIRNSIAWVVTRPKNGKVKSLFGRTEAFIGFDAGRINKSSNSSYKKGTLTGAVIGVRLNEGFVFGELAFSKAFSKPNHIASEGGLLNFRVGINF